MFRTRSAGRATGDEASATTSRMTILRMPTSIGTYSPSVGLRPTPPHKWGGALRDGYRAHRRTRRAAHLQRKAHEEELVDLHRGQLLQVQVLDDRDARSHEEEHVAGQRDLQLGIRSSYHVKGHVVRADR